MDTQQQFSYFRFVRTPQGRQNRADRTKSEDVRNAAGSNNDVLLGQHSVAFKFLGGRGRLLSPPTPDEAGPLARAEVTTRPATVGLHPMAKPLIPRQNDKWHCNRAILSF